MVHCAFANNLAREVGGGLLIFQGLHCVLTECSFIGNSARQSGGGIMNSDSIMTLVNCRFVKNSSGEGGGISNSNATSTFWPREASSRSDRAIDLSRTTSATTFTSCRFLGNTASLGGGILNVGGGPTLVNCLFVRNEADEGGGVLNMPREVPVSGETLMLVNCTFRGNASPALRGGGIGQRDKASVTLENCILWDNANSGDSVESMQILGGTIRAANCCIQGWTGRLGGIGNFGLDPLFVDPDGPDGIAGTLDDDLRLQPGSPCRDAGDNSALGADMADLDKDGDVREPIPFDIERKPRIRGGIVDLGAYESD